MLASRADHDLSRPAPHHGANRFPSPHLSARPCRRPACTTPLQAPRVTKLTDSASGYVAEAVARQIRHQLLSDDLRRHEEEHGHFSDEELAEARAKIFGGDGSAKGPGAA